MSETPKPEGIMEQEAYDKKFETEKADNKEYSLAEPYVREMFKSVYPDLLSRKIEMETGQKTLNPLDSEVTLDVKLADGTSREVTFTAKDLLDSILMGKPTNRPFKDTDGSSTTEQG